MSNPELEQLLSRVEAGTASASELERLGVLLAEAEEQFEPLVLGVDEEVELADAVMSALALEAPPVQASVQDASGTVELAVTVAPLPLDGEVAAAVEQAAGEIEVAAEVAPVSLLDAVPVAVRREGGQVEVAMQLAPLPRLDALGEAVRVAAGTVEMARQLAPLPLSEQIAAAVRDEAGAIEFAEVLAPWPLSGDLRAAVLAHAGRIDVREHVAVVTAPEALSALLDHELPEAAHRELARGLMGDRSLSRQLTAWAHNGARLRSELAEEAGEVLYLWGSVAEAIGIPEPERVPGYDGSLLAEAVREMAGTVDVSRDVLAEVRGAEVLPAAVTELEEPAPANRSWGVLSGLLAAALVVLTVLQVAQPFGGSAEEGLSAAPLQFASASEIIIDDLSADAGMVQVFMSEDEPVIIWVDEEAL